MTLSEPLQKSLDQAVQHHQAGELNLATALYRHVLDGQPDHPDALHLLGVVTFQSGGPLEALDLLRRAIILKPTAEYCANLGLVLISLNRHQDAVDTYRQALSLNDDLPVLHLGLGKALQNLGRLDEAIASYEKAIELWPDFPKAHYQLGEALKMLGRSAQAIAAYRKSLELRPDHAESCRDLAMLYFESGQLDQAITAFRRAAQLRPNIPETHNNLANALLEAGQTDLALAAYDRALALNPAYTVAHSNRVYAMNFHPDFDSAIIARELSTWDNRHAQPLRQSIAPHANDSSPERPLRIGYVSPDFRQHVVGHNLLPLFRHHDHADFKIFCYSNVAKSDVETARLQAFANHWRDIAPMSDDAAAQLIRDDRIDILIDLTLHMSRNRLLLFARKPAPIQLSYLGYCGSTGLKTIDYRISNPVIDPPNSDLSCYAEQTVRLPRSYWCYQSWEDSPQPSLLPALQTGQITFGCLNNFAKVSRPTLDAWAKILTAVPNSRMIIHCQLTSQLDLIFNHFASAGIVPNRLEFVGQQDLLDYLKTYNRIDIALDTFPYAGGITTCDALWMGVPVITLAGKTAVGRGGASILTAINLPELITKTPQQYIYTAFTWANDIPHLRQLRDTLRIRMQKSPLMDSPGFARDMENAFRSIWRKWCDDAKNTR